ncbi:hypothetical protein Bbelb_340010, partial [Branchiostoma belcheri]
PGDEAPDDRGSRKAAGSVITAEAPQSSRPVTLVFPSRLTQWGVKAAGRFLLLREAENNTPAWRRTLLLQLTLWLCAWGKKKKTKLPAFRFPEPHPWRGTPNKASRRYGRTECSFTTMGPARAFTLRSHHYFLVVFLLFDFFFHSVYRSGAAVVVYLSVQRRPFGVIYVCGLKLPVAAAYVSKPTRGIPRVRPSDRLVETTTPSVSAPRRNPTRNALLPSHPPFSRPPLNKNRVRKHDFVREWAAFHHSAPDLAVTRRKSHHGVPEAKAR